MLFIEHYKEDVLQATYNILQFNSKKSDKQTMNSLEIQLNPNATIISTFEANDGVNLYKDSELLFAGIISDFSLTYDVSGTKQFSLTCLDSEYVAFNKVWSESFSGDNEIDRAPLIIGKVLSNASIKINGGGTTNVGIKFVGYPRKDGIQVTRPNGGDQSSIEFTYEDLENNTSAYQTYVALSEDYKFPKIAFAFNFKGIVEWINELSQLDIINTSTELDNKTNPIKRAMFHYLNNSNEFIWFARTGEEEPDYIITVDEVLQLNLKSKISDNINFIIAFLGNDYDNKPVYIYRYNDYSGTPNTNESIRSWTDIARDKKEIYSDTQNDELRAAMRVAGFARADEIFKLRGEGIITGTIKTKYTNEYMIGDIITLSLSSLGYSSVRCRITQESYSFSLSNGLFKTIEVEQEVIE